MSYRSKWSFGIAILILAFGIAWIFTPPLMARAQTQPQAVFGAERWSVGTFLEGSPTYLATTGRFLASTAVIRSDRGVTEMAFIFPAAASAKVVDGASFYILGRAGSYSGDVLLSLRVYDYAGTLKRTVSAANVDLKAAPAGAWISLPLSGDLAVNPGEFLAFHVALSGAPAENLDARLLFDVTVH